MGISDDVIGDVIGASKRAKIAEVSGRIPAYSIYLRPPRRRFCDRCGLAVSRSVILSVCLCVTYERVYGRRPNMARTGKG